MIVIACEQNSPEWEMARAGKVTASRIADIVRKTKSGISASRARYMGELVAERLTGTPTPSFKSKDMDWGHETEDEARQLYCFVTNATAIPVGLVLHPTIDHAAASPDRLVGDDGLLEIKCPATHTHIETLLGAPIDPDYIKQMQWQMRCCDRAWCDFVSFDPRLPGEMQIHIVRVHRDDALIGEMESETRKFLGEVAAKVAALRSKYQQIAAE